MEMRVKRMCNHLQRGNSGGFKVDMLMENPSLHVSID